MANIVPISELAYNTTRISKICHDKSEPVYLTKDGYGDMVVLSMEQYELLNARAQAYLANARAGHAQTDPALVPQDGEAGEPDKNRLVEGGIEKLPIDDVKDILEGMMKLQKNDNPGYRKRFP
jgi:Phd_YefM.